MHNLHLVVTHADSPKEACNDVETYIEDFGTENNWRSIEGCVSEDNEVFVNDDEYNNKSWIEEEEFSTIEKINQKVKSWIEYKDYETEAPEILKRIANGERVDSTEAWKAYKFMEMYYHSVSTGVDVEKFDVLKDNYFEFHYNENGVTHTGYEKGENQKTYIVFVNMHD